MSSGFRDGQAKQVRCESGGCPHPADFTATYAMAHAGDAKLTIQDWSYCYRHARGWADVKRIAFPYDPPEVTIPNPLSRDADLELRPTQERPRRRLWYAARPAGWRRVR